MVEVMLRIDSVHYFDGYEADRQLLHLHVAEDELTESSRQRLTSPRAMNRICSYYVHTS